MSNIDNYIEDKDVFFNAENWEVVTTSNVENENLNDKFLDVLEEEEMIKTKTKRRFIRKRALQRKQAIKKRSTEKEMLKDKIKIKGEKNFSSRLC